MIKHGGCDPETAAALHPQPDQEQTAPYLAMTPAKISQSTKATASVPSSFEVKNADQSYD